jgi:hypothetical protein
MKRFKYIAFIIVTTMALMSCTKEDNPVEPTPNIDDPQEVVTDQPAYSNSMQ